MSTMVERFVECCDYLCCVDIKELGNSGLSASSPLLGTIFLSYKFISISDLFGFFGFLLNAPSITQLFWERVDIFSCDSVQALSPVLETDRHDKLSIQVDVAQTSSR